MKKSFLYSLVFLSGMLLIAFSVSAQDATPAQPATKQSAVQYTCPMHPDVVMDHPGKCPKCGMTLKKKGAAHQEMNMHSMSDSTHMQHSMMMGDSMDMKNCPMKHAMQKDSSSVAHYRCPMHHDVVTDKPGKCPKCGMTLKKMDGHQQAMHMHNMKDSTRMNHPMMMDSTGDMKNCHMNSGSSATMNN